MFLKLVDYLDFQVERIIADRISKDSLGNVIPEYLVKWKGLSYAEATWYNQPRSVVPHVQN